MSFDWWTLALQTVNFIVLVWLLHRFLYKPVLRMVDARRTEVEEQYAGARTVEATAKTELAKIEAERAGIASERTTALKAAASQADEAAAARHAQAQREATALIDQARKTLAMERDEAMAEARKAALDLGVDMARRMLDEIPATMRAEAWLERVEKHLADLSPAERDEIAGGLKDGPPLRVVSAVPLPDSAMNKWRDHLGRALGDGIHIEFDVDAALIAGVELNFPNAILRFSWRNVLQTMRSEMEDDDNAA